MEGAFVHADCHAWSNCLTPFSYCCMCDLYSFILVSDYSFDCCELSFSLDAYLMVLLVTFICKFCLNLDAAKDKHILLKMSSYKLFSQFCSGKGACGTRSSSCTCSSCRHCGCGGANSEDTDWTGIFALPKEQPRPLICPQELQILERKVQGSLTDFTWNGVLTLYICNVKVRLHQSWLQFGCLSMYSSPCP